MFSQQLQCVLSTSTTRAASLACLLWGQISLLTSFEITSEDSEGRKWNAVTSYSDYKHQVLYISPGSEENQFFRRLHTYCYIHLSRISSTCKFSFFSFKKRKKQGLKRPWQNVDVKLTKQLKINGQTNTVMEFHKFRLRLNLSRWWNKLWNRWDIQPACRTIEYKVWLGNRSQCRKKNNITL